MGDSPRCSGSDWARGPLDACHSLGREAFKDALDSALEHTVVNVPSEVDARDGGTSPHLGLVGYPFTRFYAADGRSEGGGLS
jgi:hypothetical protein